MTIASELSDAQTNLANAKNAVTAKGGTVGNTGLAGLASEIASIPSGGGTTIPSTWTELKAMTATQLKAIWPVGSIIPLVSGVRGDDNFVWKVAEYGTCKLENDNTNYPCMTLISPYGIDSTYRFDTREREFAGRTAEPTAIAGTIYYGVTTISGAPSASNTTKLNLSPGDPIPYDDYGRIYKSSIDTDGAGVNALYNYGYNNYLLSNIRQYLNASGSNWFQPSHVGDSSPTYASWTGFLSSITPNDFLSAVSPTATKCVLNSVTDGGATVTIYDKFFLASASELQFSGYADEGAGFSGVQQPNDRVFMYSRTAHVMPSNDGASDSRTRTVVGKTIGSVYGVDSSGALASQTAQITTGINICCRIILAGA